MASFFLAQIDDCLSCGICYSRLNSPKVLSCQHTFCQRCLESWACTQRLSDPAGSDESGLPCPCCRHTTEMPHGGIAELKNNFLANQLTEMMASHDGMTEEELARAFCDVCEAGKQEATSRCRECSNFLCAVCKAAHLSFKVLRHHTIVDLQEPRQSMEEAAGAAVPSAGCASASAHNDECDRHPGEALRFFCETCQRVVCRDCTVVDHPRPDHKYADLADVVGQKRGELLVSIEKSKEAEAKLNAALNDITELGRRIDAAAVAAQALVNRAADHALVISQKCIEEKRERHLQDVVSLGMQRKKIVSGRRDTLQNTLACYRQTQSLAAQIAESGSDREVLTSYQTLTNSLQQHKGPLDSDCQEISNDLDKFAFSSRGHDLGHRSLQITFHAGSLGHVSGEWAPQRKIRGAGPGGIGELRGASALAVARWGELIVVENQRRAAQVFGQDGEHQLSLATNENILREARADIDKIQGFIRAVAFSRAGHIIVCDCSNFVKVFSRQGRYLCAFLTTAPGDNCRGSVWLCCLAVDERNLIYVGDRSRRCVTVHEPTGARIRLMECTRPAQIAVCAGFLVVLPTDPTDSIKLLDHMGNTQRTLRVPESLHPWHPVSVACSFENKKILVVNGHKDGEKAVHEFSMEGEYGGCVTRDLEEPAGVALWRSQDGEELFVADDKSVKVFRKI